MEKEIDIEHSKANIASYGVGHLMREFLFMAFNTFVFFFYEVEVGLNIWFIGLAIILFAIWNAVNDPILGYLTNRPFKFTKKWGRRFPWILIGGIPMGFCYYLVFSPPPVDPTTDTGMWILFFWLLIVTCIFDTFHSLFFVNFQSLYLDKFRLPKERRISAVLNIMLGVIGLALGAIIPPLLIEDNNVQSYIFQGVVGCIFAIITMIIAIPGFREDQQIIDRYLEKHEENFKRESFVKSAIGAFKQKSFIAFMIFYTLYQTLTASMTASIPYVVRFILGMPISGTTFLMAAMLIGTLVSTPLWVKLSKKHGNGKVMLIAGFTLVIAVVPLIIIDTYMAIFINMLFFGVAIGGFWCMIFPVMSDIIEENVVKIGKREEGTLTGIQQFFGRLGIIIQTMSFALAHELTGFVEGQDIQTPLALWGIHVHLAVVPMICILLGSIVFWKLYDLNSEKVKANQEKIKELGL